MAEEVGIGTEKPRKNKRPKNVKKSADDIPMASLDGSNSKFNQLLQQAVGQTLSEAKTEKKRKKKGESSVLESLRKGEGLVKDVDETKLANTFDPDDSKFEKSNKKKQKLLEERNKQNEINIVDETIIQKEKAKKKKNVIKSTDELIEDSLLASTDKTMTLSELDETVHKTPAKKKHSRKVDGIPVSTSSQDEHSVTVSAKKPREQPASLEPIDSDKIPTPTKKKKPKAVPNAEDNTGKTDEERTPTKKTKKKPGTVAEDETVHLGHDSVTSPLPEGVISSKVKKKKRTTDDTDEEATLSPSEQLKLSKVTKTKKKESKTNNKAVLSPSEEQTSPKAKRNKKIKEECDNGMLSPTEDVGSPVPRERRKKKSKPKEGDEVVREEEIQEKPTEEIPKPKERKKKKSHEVAEPLDGAEVAEPSGMNVEDEGRILSVTIHRTDKLKNDFYIMHPMVRVHILDELTGKYLQKQHLDRPVTSFYETKNEKVKHVLPIMTKPFDFKQNKSVLPVWEELLVFNENYNYFIQNKPKVLIIYELLDFVSMNRAAHSDEGWHRIAWAFLKVVGVNRKLNTDKKVRLQLFEPPPSGLKRKSEMEEVFQWWKECDRKPYPSTLYVTLKGITPPQEVEPAERSLFATQQERGKMTYEDLKKSVNWTGKIESKQHTMSSWSRLAGQLCRLPNTMYMALPTAKKGCYVVRFSHDGRSLACACAGNEGYPILIYEIPSGCLRGKFLGHFGVVYDLSWNKLDTQLLSASSDGTARVWDLQEFGEQQNKLLPHPAFVYCSQFHPRVDAILVTGGYDQVIRVWDIGSDKPMPDLHQELEDHVGLVNSICFSEDGQKMFSADSVGTIIIWNSFVSEMPPKRGIARDWTLNKKIEDADLKGTPINYIALHPRERRLVVHSRDNIIRMFDLRIERVIQRYIGAVNFREHIRSAITPCGSFVFSGSEDHFAYAWNADTGDQVLMYTELNYQYPVTDVHYHPREHMVAFCSLGENHPVLIYIYDAAIAQFEAGLSPRQISPVPAEQEEKLGSERLAEELASKGVMTKDEFQLHSIQRYDKVMKTLSKVTAQMTATHTIDVPGMISPRNSTMMTMSTVGYDFYGSPPRTTTGSPTMFSPHAPRSMTSLMKQQQFASQNMYMKGADSWRPTFSEVGQHGRSTSPVFGRMPQLNLTASQQGKAQFNFQAAPGKTTQKLDKVYAMYDYKAQRSDELDIFAGDEITVLHKDTENWWMGELQNGQQGFFPSNYVTHDSMELVGEAKQPVAKSPDSSDTEKKKVTAVRTKNGELKFLSGAEESDDDLLESVRTKSTEKHSKDRGNPAGASQSHKNNNSKPPRKSQKLHINETNESNA